MNIRTVKVRYLAINPLKGDEERTVSVAMMGDSLESVIRRAAASDIDYRSTLHIWHPGSGEVLFDSRHLVG